MPKHYRFGGSTAGRTVACPRWVSLSKNMPSGPSSLAAMEGTLMHLLFERGVSDPEFEPAEMEGESKVIEGTKLVIKPEHIEKVYTAYDLLDDFTREYHVTKVQPEVIMSSDDETGGTADIIGWNGNHKRVDTFAIGDLKTGDGHMVYAEDNQQLLFYAWQAVLAYNKELKFSDNTRFCLFIIQPSDRRDDQLDVWDTDLKTILNFGKAFTQAQKEAKAGIGDPCPGDHCSYCPAMSVCPAKTGMVAVAQRIPKESKELADLTKALNMVDDVEAWCRSVRKVAHEQLEQGVEFPDHKMVAKRASRIWLDAPEMEDTFKKARSLKAEDYYIQKLKSPAQIEKVCKSLGVDFKKYSDRVVLHSSGTTLVKKSDPRPAAVPLKALAGMAGQLKK